MVLLSLAEGSNLPWHSARGNASLNTTKSRRCAGRDTGRHNPAAGSAFMSGKRTHNDLPDWYTRKHRVHFDREVSVDAARRLVEDPDQVAQHAFLPFITFGIQRTCWQRCDDGKRREVPKEPRPVAYAGHLDAHVFAYYASTMKPLYEQMLTHRRLTAEVLAYRKSGSGRCNIHFAEEAFSQIQEMGPCEAVALDVKGFFDHLDHKLLKRQWALLLDRSTLPRDHYAVFKNLTRWSGMDRDACFRRLGISKRQQREWRGPLGSVQDLRRLRQATPDGFPFIEKHPYHFGIPQGSSISAFLSNLYMLPFDEAMKEFAAGMGGVYRRYSDDLLLVVPPGSSQTAVERVTKEPPGTQAGLKPAKTTRSGLPRGP